MYIYIYMLASYIIFLLMQVWEMVTGKVLYHWKHGMLFLEEITNSDSFQPRYLHDINTDDWLPALNLTPKPLIHSSNCMITNLLTQDS